MTTKFQIGIKITLLTFLLGNLAIKQDLTNPFRNLMIVLLLIGLSVHYMNKKPQ